MCESGLSQVDSDDDPQTAQAETLFALAGEKDDRWNPPSANQPRRRVWIFGTRMLAISMAVFKRFLKRIVVL